MKVSKLGKASKVDMISNLPDPVLHLILSLLQGTEEVIRTSILSRRWRYLWTSVPSIDIDYSRTLKDFDKDKFKEFVYWILANKSLDLDSFRLCCSNYYTMSTVERWIHVAVTKNVKLLDLKFCPNQKTEDIKVPYCLVTCRSLAVLRLCLFGRHVSLPNITGFLALRVLELKSCKLFNDNLVKSFFKSCPLLEDLSLIDCVIGNHNELCISCSNLKNLTIDNRKEFYLLEEIMYGGVKIICPKLVFFEFGAVTALNFFFENLGSLKKAVIHPKQFPVLPLGNNALCDLVLGISHVEYLSTGSSICSLFLSQMYLLRSPSLPNLKTLELTMDFGAPTIYELIRILICLPHLESLHFIIEQGTLLWDDIKLDKAATMRILTFHLKRVKFLRFSCKEPMLDIARSLLEHGNALEEMVFELSCDKAAMFDKRSMETMKKVSKFHKASPTVKLVTLLNTDARSLCVYG